MTKTVTIDIINEKAFKLLQDLERLQLIRMRKEKLQPTGKSIRELKGAMTKQSSSEIDFQLNELRNAWE